MANPPQQKAGCDLCERCDFFDNSHHKNDVRTEHAGICKRWSNVTWKNESCREFINGSDLGTWDDVINELHAKPIVKTVTQIPTPTQLNLF